MEIFSKFLILDNEWQRKNRPQSQAEPGRAATRVSQTPIVYEQRGGEKCGKFKI